MIKVLVSILIFYMAMPMALVTVIMVAVVTIILPSPKKSGILNRPHRTIIMVMTCDDFRHRCIHRNYVCLCNSNNIITSTALIIITIVAI